MFILQAKRAAATMAMAMALTGAASADSSTRLLTILTSGEAETQAMALVLSNKVAKAGTPVHLMLCGPAGDLDLDLDTPPEATTKVITPKGMTV